jgi:hypothetical protein
MGGGIEDVGVMDSIMSEMVELEVVKLDTV